jgi:hypothetical protein
VSPFGLIWLPGGAVLTDSRARRRDWPGGQASGLPFLGRGPLPCEENPADWAVRVGVVTVDRSGGHGVVGGRVVVLSAGVADAGGDDSGAMTQLLLRGPETAPARIAVSVFSLIAVLPPKLC